MYERRLWPEMILDQMLEFSPRVTRARRNQSSALDLGLDVDLRSMGGAFRSKSDTTAGIRRQPFDRD
jgi:hypothetical protein